MPFSLLRHKNRFAEKDYAIRHFTHERIYLFQKFMNVYTDIFFLFYIRLSGNATGRHIFWGAFLPGMCPCTALVSKTWIVSTFWLRLRCFLRGSLFLHILHSSDLFSASWFAEIVLFFLPIDRVCAPISLFPSHYTMRGFTLG